ncbi:hypothetical protein JIG36_33205 [Actinoplanes sp. LDG1-06]|uniref:phenylalanine--tRNA ligase n=1 Tax=Paractinoplanes ovalisporus TaxID=2810368 RepID=A0ABS2AKM9_9ACTN|nr:hypothetical protein [Actinoplanes ovalisporus]MBM2620381.1 hypothetical protein [Actinoplanes ovalisporus]
MRVPLSWLNEFLSKPVTVREADDLLGTAGMAITRVDVPGWRSPRIVAGRLGEERDGTTFAALPAPEPVRLPAGARPAPGSMVAVALPGARLYAPGSAGTAHGLDIVPAPARDGDPVGLVCTPAGLGLGPSGTAIVLPPATAPGTPVAAALDPAPASVADDILHLTVPTELADCDGLWGLAGEIAQRDRDRHRVTPHGEPGPHGDGDTIRLSVDGCGWTVCAAILPGGAAERMPDLLRDRLRLTGLDDDDPVTGAVRVAAYEFGVRLVTVELSAAGPVDVTVGGDQAVRTGPAVRWPAELAVHVAARTPENTAPPRLLVLAAARTEVSADGDRCDRAVHRVAALLAPGRPPVRATTEGPAAPRHEILVDVADTGSRLGLPLSTDECARLLTGRGLTVRAAGPNRLVVAIPAHRTDLRTRPDLIAEIVRLTGYRALPGTVPGDPVPPPRDDRSARSRAARDAAVAHGFQEVVTPMVIDADAPVRTSALHLHRGGSRTGRIVRRSLLPGLAAVAAAQTGRRGRHLDLVETGAVVLPEAGDHRERPQLAVVRALPEGSGPDAAETALHQVGAAVRSAARAAGVPVLTVRAAERALYRPGTAVEFVAAGRCAGWMGLLAGSALGVPGTWTFAAAEVDLVALLADPAVHRRLVAPPAQRTIETDVNLLVPDEVPAAELAGLLRAGPAALRRAGIVDVYRDARLPDGHRRVTVRLEVASDWRPVTRQEAAAACDEAISAMTELGVRRWTPPQEQSTQDNNRNGVIR